jgi:hypothetical protein
VGQGLDLGVILSGATTFFSSFFAGPPVSFYLAQCALFRSDITNLAQWVKLGKKAGKDLVSF